MARSHSWVSPKCEVRTSQLGGLGLFAAEPFEVSELVCIWGGVVVTGGELERLRTTTPAIDDRVIAIYDGFWRAPFDANQDDDSERFNHSCDPNAGIKGQVVVVARRAIPAGEEVTFDYETAETAMPAFTCRCGSPWCRGTIDGSASRNPEFLRRHAEFLSWHLTANTPGPQMGHAK